METCTIKQVYEAVLRRGGLDPSTADVTAAEKANIAELINTRFRDGYTDAFWPEILEVDQRRYRSTWDTDSTYLEDEEVWYENDDEEGAYYRSLQDANLGQTPDYDADTDWWEKIVDGDTEFIRYIELEQDGETVIGAVDVNNCLFDQDPRLFRDAGRVSDVCLLGDKILVEAADAPAEPYLRFRLRPPEFSLTDWSAATEYAINDLVYYSTSGETYKALVSSTNQNPYTETTYWEPVEFPRFLKDFVVVAVAADRLTEDEARYKSLADAEARLEKMHEVLIDQQSGLRRARYVAAR